MVWGFQPDFVVSVVDKQFKQVEITQRENQRKLASLRKREQELDILFEKIYEDQALGNLPDAQCKKLLAKYQDEYTALAEQLRHMQAVVDKEIQQEISVLKSYIGVCLEGAIVMLACIIFNAYGSFPAVSGGADSVTQVWIYLVQTAFHMLVLVALIKGSDRIVKEMLGL